MTKETLANAGDANNILETSSTRFIKYDGSNIGTLTKAKTTTLWELYFDSYCRSIWSTVLQQDRETCDVAATNKLKEWYSTQKGRCWFRDALKFYVDQTKEGNCLIVVAEDKKSGKMIAASFVLLTKAFLENANKGTAEELGRIIEQIGASPGNTLYGGEIFVSPDFRGFRGGLVLLGVIEQTLNYALGRGYTHIVAWTLERADNSILHIADKIGFTPVPEGSVEKGADIGRMENHKLGFIKGDVGPAAYLYADAPSFLKAMALVGNSRFGAYTSAPHSP